MSRLLLILAATLLATDALAARAKDVGRFLGVRDNSVTGPGLVVGLRRTGDSTRNSATLQSLVTRLQGQGASLGIDDVSSRNAALVIVRATLPPDYRAGDRVDVTVASAGDATSLEGGVLMWTPLFDQRNTLVGIAEGNLVVGGFAADAAGNAIRKNNPTAALVPGGGLIERENELALDYASLTETEFVLDKPDFATTVALAEAINQEFGSETVAAATSGSTVRLTLPPELVGKFPIFASRVGAVDVAIDAPARVVVSERTGTVVMGADVLVSAVAVAHGSLTIEVRRTNAVSQPNALTLGNTARVSNTEVVANEAEGQLVLVEGASIGDLVASLNAMGVKPRDLVVILQAIRAAGALQAEIVSL